MQSNRVRLLVEILAWCALFIFPVALFPGFWPKFIDGHFNPLFLGLSLTNMLLISFYYFHSYFLIPKFYFTKKYALYTGSLFALLFVIVFILLSKKEFNPLPSPPFRYATGAFAGSIVIRYIMLFLFSLGVSSYSRLKQIEREKMKAELSYLKAQINPHFLFNTLNNIYALTVKKSDRAPESVTRLSAIMRYVITDAAQELVPLEKEIEYIQNYIELEELRITNKVKLIYTVSGDLSGKKIAPLIFVPYVENAFKHGVSTKDNSEIRIGITVSGNELHLLVKNNKVNVRTISNGLGMENTKKRLQLVYPGRHILDIKNEEKEFELSLKIMLND